APTVILTDAMAPPVVTPVTVPGSWLRMDRPGTGPVASATSVDFTSARTADPSASPRSLTDSAVPAAVTSGPPSRRTLTVAMTSPGVMEVTVPGIWLRMLRLMTDDLAGRCGYVLVLSCWGPTVVVAGHGRAQCRRRVALPRACGNSGARTERHEQGARGHEQ